MTATHADTVHTAVIDYGFDATPTAITTLTEQSLAWAIELELSENPQSSPEIRAWVEHHGTGRTSLAGWLADFRIQFPTAPFITCYAITPDGITTIDPDDTAAGY